MERTQRALAAMQRDASESRKALKKILSRAKRTLRGTVLASATEEAAWLCTGILEKAYLAKLAGRICAAPKRECELVGVAAELLMFSALTIDDWADRASIRAGQKPMYLRHSAEVTTLIANCLAESAHLALAEASEMLMERRDRLVSSFSAANLAIQAGQATVATVAGNPISSLATVDRLARLRCGTLISTVMASAALLGGRDNLYTALSNMGLWIGVSLQHRNDIQDFTVAYDGTAKPPLADLLNGQPNLVVACLLRRAPDMPREEQEFIASIHGRSRTGAHATTVSALEFERVLEIVRRHRVGEMAVSKLARCVEKALSASYSISSVADLEPFKDYCALLLES